MIVHTVCGAACAEAETPVSAAHVAVIDARVRIERWRRRHTFDGARGNGRRATDESVVATMAAVSRIEERAQIGSTLNMA